MPSWKRNVEHELEAQLRSARPEPRAEVTQAIADQVRPRRSPLKRRIGRLQLALAASITALALTPVVAMGFSLGGPSLGGFNPLNFLHGVVQSADEDAATLEVYGVSCDALVDLDVIGPDGLLIDLELLDPGDAILVALNINLEQLGIVVNLCISV